MHACERVVKSMGMHGSLGMEAPGSIHRREIVRMLTVGERATMAYQGG
jgi:hypothetical protein